MDISLSWELKPEGIKNIKTFLRLNGFSYFCCTFNKDKPINHEFTRISGKRNTR